MPTLPMYHTPSDPDAWHRVTAPGGYEWWHFDAEDEAGDVRVVARIYDGYPLDRQYVRAYTRYLSRPTRRTPPVPGDFPYAELAVYRGGKVWGRFGTRYPRGAFSAAVDRAKVKLGLNQIIDDGEIQRVLMADDASAVRAELCFRGRRKVIGFERSLLGRDRVDSAHRWVVTSSPGDVEGLLRIGAERIELRGRGYRDHRYGTAPLATAGRRWVSGRALLGEQAAVFHLLNANDRAGGTESQLVRFEGGGFQFVDAAAEVRWDARLEAYPSEVNFGEGLVLRNGRTIDTTPFAQRVIYDARLDGSEGSALCEILHPPAH